MRFAVRAVHLYRRLVHIQDTDQSKTMLELVWIPGEVLLQVCHAPYPQLFHPGYHSRKILQPDGHRSIFKQFKEALPFLLNGFAGRFAFGDVAYLPDDPTWLARFIEGQGEPRFTVEA